MFISWLGSIKYGALMSPLKDLLSISAEVNHSSTDTTVLCVAEGNRR